MNAIHNAKNLQDLLAALRAAEAAGEAAQIDMASLPTFGGEEPADTNGVWSWDSNNLLVGSCIGTGQFSDDLKIVRR